MGNSGQTVSLYHITIVTCFVLTTSGNDATQALMSFSVYFQYTLTLYAVQFHCSALQIINSSILRRVFEITGKAGNSTAAR
jgi:hypothetical protein